MHFHYTAWADFDVPECCTFLEYLNAVRESGSLDDNVGPPIVHCSAGMSAYRQIRVYGSSPTRVYYDTV